MSERLGKAVVIENRGGAGCDARHRDLGQSRAGRLHALGLPGSGSMAVDRRCNKQLPYDPTKDFAPMALIGRVPFVGWSSMRRWPWKTVPELIALRQGEQDLLRLGRAGLAASHLRTPRCSKGMTGNRDDARAVQGQRRRPSRTWWRGTCR